MGKRLGAICAAFAAAVGAVAWATSGKFEPVREIRTVPVLRLPANLPSTSWISVDFVGDLLHVWNNEFALEPRDQQHLLYDLATGNQLWNSTILIPPSLGGWRLTSTHVVAKTQDPHTPTQYVALRLANGTPDEEAARMVAASKAVRSEYEVLCAPRNADAPCDLPAAAVPKGYQASLEYPLSTVLGKAHLRRERSDHPAGRFLESASDFLLRDRPADFCVFDRAKPERQFHLRDGIEVRVFSGG